MIVTPTASQLAHAEQLVSESDRWLTGRAKADGRPFYVIPGSKGVAHWTAADGSGCTCRGFAYRGQCSHVLAVRLRRRRKRATCRVCTQELAVGVLSGECADCQDIGAFFDGVAAIKAAFGAEHPDDVVRAFGA